MEKKPDHMKLIGQKCKRCTRIALTSKKLQLAERKKQR